MVLTVSDRSGIDRSQVEHFQLIQIFQHFLAGVEVDHGPWTDRYGPKMNKYIPNFGIKPYIHLKCT